MEAGHVFRCDVAQTSAQRKKCMRVLPVSKNKTTQRIVVGDDMGVLQAFSAKDGVASSAFKHLPTYSPVGCVTLGEGPNQGDRIFVASEQLISGVSKKGAEFFRFMTNLTETITTLKVISTHIYTVGAYYLNQMEESRDTDFYMAADKINDMCVLPIVNAGQQNPILACQDRSIKVVSGSELYYETSLDGPVTELAFAGSHPTEMRGPGGLTVYAKEVVFGTKNGAFGRLDMDPETIRRGWVVEPGGSAGGASGGTFGMGGGAAVSASRAGVTSLNCEHDFSRSGQPDVIVAREDGTLEVFEFLRSGQPTLTHSRNMNESVQALSSGYITNGDVHELVVSTYSGRVAVVSNTPVGTVLSPDSAQAGGTAAAGDAGQGAGGGGGGGVGGFLKKGANFFGVLKDKHGKDVELSKRERNAQQLSALKREVDELFEAVHHKRKAYKEQSTGLIAGSNNLAKVNGAFTLNPEDASYLMSIELPVPIFSIALHANVKMELLDTDATVAIVSETKDPLVERNGKGSGDGGGIKLGSPGGRGSGGATEDGRVEEGQTLVTYRLCRDQSMARVGIRVREGQTGLVHVYIIPRVAPKTTTVATFKLKPLCLHMRTDRFDESRPSNVLKVSGKFTVAEIHMWVGMCLPEIPSKPPGDERIEYVFLSTLLGTLLKCSYKAGEAIFTTDAITPLTAIKEVITKEATARKQQVNVTFKLEDSSLPHMCRMISPKIEYQLALARQVREIEALQEVSMQEEEAMNFLSPEYRNVLKRQDEIQAEFKRQPKQLAYLTYVVKTMFLDWYRFKGINVRNRLSLIDEAFRDFSPENLIAAVTLNE